MSSVVIVLAAPGPVTRAVRDVLYDWSAVGLLNEYLWLDQHEVLPTAPELAPAVSVRSGRRTADRLQSLLSDPRYQDVSLCVLSTATGPVPGERLADPKIAAIVRNEITLSARQGTVAVHCLLTRHGRGGWDDRGLWEQWHNAVVAPEDAVAPGVRPTRLTSHQANDMEDHAFGLHGAAALAGVTGLWKGMPAGPFRDVSYPNGPSAVVVRSFVRHLDATAVTGHLRSEFIDVRNGLPRPQVNGVRLEYVDESAEARAADRMAQAVVDRHPGIFVSEREPLPERVRVSGLAMVRLFLTFFWASLRRAPGDWVDKLQRRYSSSAARMIQNLAGGDDSPYKVIVRGVDASGLSDRVEQLAAATESLARELGLPSRDEVVPPLASFWKEAHGGALTLADGESHVPPLQPPVVGGRPAVFRRSDRIVVGNDVFVVAGSLAARTIEQVPAHDVRTADLLDEALEGLAASATRASREAASERERLRDWRGRLRTSYFGQIGKRIDREMRRRLEDLLAMLDELDRSAHGQDAGQEMEDTDDALGSALRRGLGALAFVVLAIIAARVVGAMSTTHALIALVVAVVVAVAVSLLVFLRSAQRRFAQLCAEQSPERVDVLVRNMTRAAHEAHTLSLAYLQYLEWAPVLHRFLREPLGSVAGVTDEPLPAGPLPRAMGLGRAVADARSGGRLIDDVRDDLLGPGWLGSLWEEILANAPGQFGGRSGFSGREERLVRPEDLFRDRMTGDSALRYWSRLVQQNGLPPDHGELIWRAARERLFGASTSQPRRGLFSQVKTAGQDGDPVRSSGETFLTGLFEALNRPRNFDRELFTPAGRTGAGTSVVATYVVADPALISTAGLGSRTSGLTVVDALRDDPGSLDQFVAVVEMSALLAGNGNLRLSGETSPAAASGTTVEVPESGVATGPRANLQERL